MGDEAGRMGSGAGGSRRTAANRFGLDYRHAAAGLPALPAALTGGIIDAHAHINGQRAAAIWAEQAELFGVRRVYTMVRLDDAPMVRGVLGDRARFIAFPNFRAPDRAAAFGAGFLEDVRRFHGEFGARVVKLWNSPRLRELVPASMHAELVEFDAPARVRVVELAQQLGMAIMVHVADPDTWFATKYTDAAKFGTKRGQYRGLEVMLRRFPGPWIAAHMGGCPEDLTFLSEMLERHANLYLDTSATKWVVRELSAHPRGDVVAFFTRWRGRILFGSDIVTTDEHLVPRPTGAGAARHPMADLAESPESAAELYASRYFALRSMFETTGESESPIADPDLMLADPAKHDAMSAPKLRGLGLAPDLLVDLYRGTAERLLEAR